MRKRRMRQEYKTGGGRRAQNNFSVVRACAMKESIIAWFIQRLIWTCFSEKKWWGKLKSQSIKAEKMAISYQSCWICQLFWLVLFLGINYHLPGSLNNICWPSWLQQLLLISEDNAPRWVLAHSLVFPFLFSCVHLPSSIFVNFYAFSLIFLLPLYSFFPICVSILMFFCSTNISPTYICFTLVNMEVLSVSLSVLYPFFPSTHTLPWLHIATLSPAVHPRTGVHEHRNTACWGLPGTLILDAVSYKDMLNSTEDVPRDLGPSTWKAIKY